MTTVNSLPETVTEQPLTSPVALAQIDATEETNRRRDYAQGLRELADFIDAHPDIPCPYGEAHNAFVRDKAQLGMIARAVGGRWDKNGTSQFFYIRREFAGGHSYEVNVSRDQVCRKVVTGTRIEPAVPEREVEVVEWVCTEPLLVGVTE